MSYVYMFVWVEKKTLEIKLLLGCIKTCILLVQH